jgi:hypothetical protein
MRPHQGVIRPIVVAGDNNRRTRNAGGVRAGLREETTSGADRSAVGRARPAPPAAAVKKSPASFSGAFRSVGVGRRDWRQSNPWYAALPQRAGRFGNSVLCAPRRSEFQLQNQIVRMRKAVHAIGLPIPITNCVTRFCFRLIMSLTIINEMRKRRPAKRARHKRNNGR